MKVDPRARVASVRARLVALFETGARLGEIAQAADPPFDENDLSAFKSGKNNGRSWGGDRVERLAAALDLLERARAVPDERPTDRAPPPDPEEP